ncbi:MAG: ComEC/Rec2 family competence protein [candidate division WOR-3 bacterium]
MRYASSRALAVVALGVAVAKELPWFVWPAVAAGIIGLLLQRMTRGWSLYLVLIAAAGLYTRARLPEPPPDELYAGNSFTGMVVYEPQSGEQRLYEIDLKYPGDGRVLLRVRDQNLQLRYGDLIRVRSRIHPLAYPRNPGVTDMNRVLHERGIAGIVNPRPDEISVIGSGHGSVLMRCVLMPVRRYVAQTIKRFLPQPERGLLSGLILGGRRWLPREVQRTFADAGIIHVLAVSGLHVGIVLGVAWLLLSVLCARGWWRFVLSAGLTAIYAGIVGWTPAAARAWLMATMTTLSQPSQRRYTPVAGLCTAGLVLLFINPLTLFDIGAQLSFAGTLWIPRIGPRIGSLTARWHSIGRLRRYVLLPAIVCAAAGVGTAPLLLHHYGRVQLLGVAASALVVPLLGLIIPVGLLMISLNLVSQMLAGFAGEVVRIGLAVLLAGAKLFGSVSWAAWQPGKLSWPWVFWLYGLGLIILAWRQRWARRALRLGLLGGLAVFFWTSALRKPSLEVVFLDPGNGDALLIQDTLGRLVLVDAGIDRHGVLLEYLRTRGVRKIDLAVVTHPDRDHFGGLLNLDRTLRVEHLLVPTRMGDSLYTGLLRRTEEQGTRVHVVGNGTRVEGLGFGLRFVWPDRATSVLYERGLIPTNAVSLVALAEYRGFRMLLSGDLDEPTVFSELGIKADLLKSPHHGSRKGNAPVLFEAVRPDYVVVMGRYPTPAGLEEMLAGRGVRYINTRRDGGCVMRFSGSSPHFFLCQ